MSDEDARPAGVELIAACGLFCGNCGAYRKGKCRGCAEAPLFASCKIRACCRELGLRNCAGCADFPSPRSYAECGKINNFISKIFALLFRSDRPGALALLRDCGTEEYLRRKRDSGKH